MDDSDLALLERHARHGDQAAFAEIVRRHLDLVHSVALRHVRSPQLAEEVAQSVFADLARSAGRLGPGTVLPAWLWSVARRTAVDAVRREARRCAREQTAHELSAMNTPDADWSQVAPLLDEALQSLDETDRAVVVLRWFENRPLREVGAALGLGEDAAQKRASRALDRLREFFARRGITASAGGLAAIISTNAVQAAPAGLAAAVSGSAFAASAAGAATAGWIAALLSTFPAMTTLTKTAITATAAGILALAIPAYYLWPSTEVHAPLSEIPQMENAKEQASASNAIEPVAVSPAQSLAAENSGSNIDFGKTQGAVTPTSRQFQFATGPESAASTVLAFAKARFGPPPYSPSELVSDPDKLSVAPPLARYHLLDNQVLIDGAGLEAAVADGFYYPIMEDELQVAYVNIDSGSPLSKINNLGTLTKASATLGGVLTAINELSGTTQISPSMYEARLLYLPQDRSFGTGRPQQVIWLAPVNGDGSDILYLVDKRGGPRGLKANRTYSPKEFFNTIYPQRIKPTQ
jgi:RNA polymerase sigma factor (sigma-70 family)